MKTLTIEIVNNILEGCDSDRSVRLSEDGAWVEVVTSAFYDDDEDCGETDGDVVSTYRVYPHEYGLHQALLGVLKCETGFWPISRFVESQLKDGNALIGIYPWPGLCFKEEFLATLGYEIDEYPFVKKVAAAPEDTNAST